MKRKKETERERKRKDRKRQKETEKRQKETERKDGKRQKEKTERDRKKRQKETERSDRTRQKEVTESERKKDRKRQTEKRQKAGIDLQWQTTIFFINIAPFILSGHVRLTTCNDVENLVIKDKEVLAVDRNVTSTT